MSKTLRQHIKTMKAMYEAPAHPHVEGNLFLEAEENVYQSVAMDLGYVLKITEGEENGQSED